MYCFLNASFFQTFSGNFNSLVTGWILKDDMQMAVRFTEQHARLQEHAMVKKHNVTADGEAATRAILALKALKVRLDAASAPFEAGDFLTELRPALENIKSTCSLLRQHRDGFDKIEANAQAAVDARKETWTRERDLKQTKLKDSEKIPRGMAKLVADSYQSFLEDPAPLGLPYEVNAEKDDLKKGDLGTQQYWDVCRVIGKREGEDQSDMYTAAQEWVETHRGAIDARIAKNNLKLLGGSPIAVGAVLDAAKFEPWKGDVKPFDNIATDPTLITQDANRMDTRHPAWFGKGFRCVCTALQGLHIVVVVPPVLVTRHADLHAWLKDSAESKDLNECRCFAISPGQSVFVAFGWQPYFMVVDREALGKQDRGKKSKKAVPSKSTAQKEELRGSIVVHHFLDKTVDATYSTEIKNLVAREYGLGSQWAPASVSDVIASSGYCEALRAKASAGDEGRAEVDVGEN